MRKSKLESFMMEKRSKDATGAKTIKALNEQEKVSVFIPSKREGDLIWEGSINGVRIHVKKDEMVLVPKAVAELIENNTKVIIESRKMMEKYTEGAGPKLAEMN